MADGRVESGSSVLAPLTALAQDFHEPGDRRQRYPWILKFGRPRLWEAPLTVNPEAVFDGIRHAIHDTIGARFRPQHTRESIIVDLALEICKCVPNFVGYCDVTTVHAAVHTYAALPPRNPTIFHQVSRRSSDTKSTTNIETNNLQEA